MANTERGEVSFQADGRNWTMKIDTNAMCEIEEMTGHSIAEVGQLLSNPKTASIKLMRAVFYGGLATRHEDLNINQAGRLIDILTLPKAVEIIGEAFQIAFPQQQKGAKPRPPKGTPTPE